MAWICSCWHWCMLGKEAYANYFATWHADMVTLTNNVFVSVMIRNHLLLGLTECSRKWAAGVLRRPIQPTSKRCYQHNFKVSQTLRPRSRLYLSGLCILTSTDFDIGLRCQQFAPMLGAGIFAQPMTTWKHSRQMIRPLFIRNKQANFDNIRTSVEALLDKVSADVTVDLQPLFLDYALRTAMFFIFGDATRSIDPHQEMQEHTAFTKAFALGQRFLAQRSYLGNLYWLLATPKFCKTCETVRSHVGSIVCRALEHAATPDDIGIETSSMSVLQRRIDDRSDLRDQCMSVLFAARDTTASCLSWTM